MSEIDRKYSNGVDWDNSIDSLDASDGSDGGYDRHGNHIQANVMKELVQLRAENAELKRRLSLTIATLRDIETLSLKELGNE